MVLILLATALILAIAFFQVTQGFYSATIMVMLSVLSAAVAFHFYEPLASLLTPYQPAAADALALLAIFVILLLGLRLAIDYFFRHNAVMGVWVDRIGGGIVGLLTGMTLAWGPSILGYRPFDDSLQRRSRLYPFSPDDFVVGLIKRLSDPNKGSLARGSTRGFVGAHDDLLLELFCARNTAGKNGRIDAEAGSLSVGSAYTSEGASWGDDVPAGPRLGEQVTKVIVVRATVDRGAADKGGWWRLPATHFRLVSDSGRSYYPVGYMIRSATGLVCVPAPSQEGRLQVARLIVEHQMGREKTVSIDWAYRLLPQDTPTTLVFRRRCQAAVPKPSSRLPDLTARPEGLR
jgi:uncharacterized membrane protein required for colicin V production